jgi:hypothetical protein
MRGNITRPDRAVRLMLGLALLGLFGAAPAPWKYLTLIGLIPFGTALTGYCPAYAALGWNRRVTRGGIS